MLSVSRCMVHLGVQDAQAGNNRTEEIMPLCRKADIHVWDVEAAGSNPATPTNFSKIRDFFQVSNLITAIFKTFLTFYFKK